MLEPGEALTSPRVIAEVGPAVMTNFHYLVDWVRDTGKEDADDKWTKWPDLVFIDGGPGHIAAARQALAEVGADDVILVGIAKSIERESGREHFHCEGKKPFRLEPKSPVLYYIQRLRDEAHRFAIAGHRARRSKAIAANPLDEIGGIGAARKKALLAHFGSAKAVADATLVELESVNGVSAALAKKIYDLMLTDGAAPDDLGLHKIEITEQVLATANISLDESLDPITLRRFFDND